MDRGSGAKGRATGGTSPSRATTGGAERETGDVKQEALGDAREEKHEARDAIREVKHEAKEAARGAKDEAKKAGRRVKQEAERQTDRWASKAGQQVGAIARALDAAAERLHEDDQGQLGSWVGEAGEEVERMAGYLRDEDPGSMFRDLEDLARRNPGAFLGTTFAAGLAMGRFLRASEPSDSRNSGNGTRGGSLRADDERSWASKSSPSWGRGATSPASRSTSAPGGAPTGGVAGSGAGTGAGTAGGDRAKGTGTGGRATEETSSGSGDDG